MPFGLMMNTRPLDCRLPRIWLGLPPVTRLSTVLAALCWTKRVNSPVLIEKLFQLMIAPGLLVTVRVLPLRANVADPLTTVGATGLA